MKLDYQLLHHRYYLSFSYFCPIKHILRFGKHIGYKSLIIKSTTIDPYIKSRPFYRRTDA